MPHCNSFLVTFNLQEDEELKMYSEEEELLIVCPNLHITVSSLHVGNLRRKVRSRLYSRLYSQERYQNVIKKSELKYFVENKLREVLPFAEEFER